RDSQYDYNLCNFTIKSQESQCQISFVNSIEDSCLLGPPEPNMMVGNYEGEMVS
ncbi:hypothetical protein BDQ17DRAFT_1216381, partial [Cyathus striatus]